MPKITLDTLLFGHAWRRESPGAYKLVGRYLSGTEDILARAEGSGNKWTWATFAVWTKDPTTLADEGSCASLKTAKRQAETSLIADLDYKPSRNEIIEHNRAARAIWDRLPLPPDEEEEQ